MGPLYWTWRPRSANCLECRRLRISGQSLGDPAHAPVVQELMLDGVERQGLLGDAWDYSFSEGVNQ